MICKACVRYLAVIMSIFVFVFFIINCENDDGSNIKHIPKIVYPKTLVNTQNLEGSTNQNFEDFPNEYRTPKICWDLFCNTTALTGQTEANFTQEYLDERIKNNDPLEKLYFEWTPSGNASFYEIILYGKLFCKIKAFDEPYNISNINENNPRRDVKDYLGKVIGTVYFKAIPQYLLEEPNKISTQFNYVYHLELDKNPDLTNYKDILDYYSLKKSIVAWKWYVIASNYSKQKKSEVGEFIIEDTIAPKFKNAYGITKEVDNDGNVTENKIEPYTEDKILFVPYNPNPNHENNIIEFGCKVSDDVGITYVNIYYNNILIQQTDYSGPMLPDAEGYIPFSLTLNPRAIDPNHFGRLVIIIEICDAAENRAVLVYNIMMESQCLYTPIRISPACDENIACDKNLIIFGDRIAWNPVENATGYHIKIANDQELVDLVVDTTVTDTYFRLDDSSDLETSKTYYYDVQAVGDCGESKRKETKPSWCLNLKKYKDTATKTGLVASNQVNQFTPGELWFHNGYVYAVSASTNTSMNSTDASVYRFDATSMISDNTFRAANKAVISADYTFASGITVTSTGQVFASFQTNSKSPVVLTMPSTGSPVNKIELWSARGLSYVPAYDLAAYPDGVIFSTTENSNLSPLRVSDAANPNNIIGEFSTEAANWLAADDRPEARMIFVCYDKMVGVHDMGIDYADIGNMGNTLYEITPNFEGSTTTLWGTSGSFVDHATCAVSSRTDYVLGPCGRYLFVSTYAGNEIQIFNVGRNPISSWHVATIQTDEMINGGMSAFNVTVNNENLDLYVGISGEPIDPMDFMDPSNSGGDHMVARYELE